MSISEEDDQVWKLEEKGESYLLYPRDQGEVKVDLRGFRNDFLLYEINKKNGTIENEITIPGNKIVPLETTKNIIFITKRNNITDD